MTEVDVESVTKVHELGFPRHLDSREWILCNLRAFPRMQYFVAEDAEGVVGYLQWCQRGGFRQKVVLELEHIAVLPNRRGQGIGHELIASSLPEVEAHLRQRGAEIKHVLVTTRADNQAQRLYKKALAAQVEFTIPDLYSADEVYMISRNFGQRKIRIPSM